MTTVLHATCVDLDGQGVLITGASGSGKSELGLALIAQGAALVADDQTALTNADDTVIASRPPTLPPLIEARGVGLLRAPLCDETPLRLVIDLDQTEAERLPPLRYVTYLGCDIPLLHRAQSLGFPSAILTLIRHGREKP